MTKLAPKKCRIILIDDKNIINHGIHLTIPEENGEVIAHDFFELIIIFLVMIIIGDLEQLILNNNFSENLYTITIDIQIIHPYYRDDIQYDASTKADSLLKLLPASMHPILQQLGLF